MPLTKTQAEGINLADTFAFTGTVTGAGGLVSATEVDASGTQVDFTSIPDGVKHIKVIDKVYQYQVEVEHQIHFLL